MDYIEIAEELEERGKGLKEYIGHIENELKLAQENYANNMAEYETMAETALEWQRKGINPSLHAWYDEKAREKERLKRQPDTSFKRRGNGRVPPLLVFCGFLARNLDRFQIILYNSMNYNAISLERNPDQTGDYGERNRKKQCPKPC